jgi:hypothetical protein
MSPGRPAAVDRRAADARRGRVVLVVDDILDEGVTMAEIASACWNRAPPRCCAPCSPTRTSVAAKPIAADFVGVHLPNRYVFGYGMDVKGAWRNLPAVYAVKGSVPAEVGGRAVSGLRQSKIFGVKASQGLHLRSGFSGTMRFSKTKGELDEQE